MRTVTLALAAVVLLGAAVAAEDKKDAKKAAKKPLGTWAREVNNVTLEFDIKADDIKITLKDGNGNSVEAEAAYGVTKDGVAFGSVTKVTRKGIDGGPEKGDLFGFNFSVNDKEMTISDLKGTNVNEDGRKLVEGVYNKK